MENTGTDAKSDAKTDGLDDPHARLRSAAAAFEQVNRTLPEAMAPFQLPPFLEPAAGLDALVSILIEAGLVEETAFIERKVTRMATMVEAAVEAAKALKRQALGIHVAHNARVNGKHVATR